MEVVVVMGQSSKLCHIKKYNYQEYSVAEIRERLSVSKETHKKYEFHQS
jgi:hypothetical protein